MNSARLIGKRLRRLLAAVIGRVFFFLPDSIYLKIRFRLLMEQKLDLKNPKTFNEKLNWLKIYDRNPLYHTLVDKALVKDWVAAKVGKEHIVPTLGVWENFDEIDFENLPNQFVLKTTNGGGGEGVYICRDKSKMDKDAVKKKLKVSCAVDWKIQREWVYAGLKTKYIAEEYMEDDDGELKDYKFFCFNGKVEFFKVDFNRSVEHHANYYDYHGLLLPFGELICTPKVNKEIFLPHNLKQMIQLAEILSCSIPFVRVDLYSLKEKVFFGEMTFYPNGGFGVFTDGVWDYKIGKMLKLKK